MRPFKQVMSFSGNYPEKCPVRIWKRDRYASPGSPYRSFNFQQLFFYEIFCATRIAITSYRSSKYTTVNRFFTDFFGIIKKTSKIKFIK